MNSQTTKPKTMACTSKAHVCAICGDKASGKHYGVHSCEGCKGFFKRTVRKDLTYTCRDSSRCIVDRRQRNRCQYCRYHKCLLNGMKREAVQEERHKFKHKSEGRSFSPSSFYELKEELKDSESYNELDDDLVLVAEEKSFLERITKAEDSFNPEKAGQAPNPCSIDALYESVELQLNCLPQWARSIEEFQSLDIEDQVSLLKENWPEILSISLAHRSIHSEDSLLLATGRHLSADQLTDDSLKSLVERLIEDVVNMMKDLDIDRIELALLKLILLFDSDAKNLKDPLRISEIRNMICQVLSKYCRRDQYLNDSARFGKLLMRLPPLRSWVLKGSEHIFSIKANNSFDSILVEAFAKNQNKEN